MKKEDIRKEYFKLRIKGHTNNQCRKIMLAQFGYEINIRTLRRWTSRLNNSKWDLKDKSTTPKRILRKITEKDELRIVEIKKKTGWGERKIENFVGIGHTSINKILNKHNLTNSVSRKKKRNKYIRWERKHPNSLWQMDITDQKLKNKYCFSVIDDCSRFCLGMFALNKTSTKTITKLLDDLITKHGKPREILTDNGSVFGLRSKHSKFDRWCRNRDIKHIRTAIHSPTTTGKIERLFQTLANELSFCENNSELFRMRYNHFRPHSSLDNNAPSDICPWAIHFCFINAYKLTNVAWYFP